MALSVAVLGATGVYGRYLVPRLVARGHHVRALVRRPEAAMIAAACGAEIHVSDIFDAVSLRTGLEGCDIGINLATSLPRPDGGSGDYATNDRVRRDGVPIWVRACQDAGVSRIIQQSIAMVNGDVRRAWGDEDTVFPPGEGSIAARAIAAALAMEDVVRQSSLDWIILRGGLFYGAGTGCDDDWFARARAGRLRLPAEGDDYVSLVHIADMAEATVAAIARWPSRRALIVADDRPIRWLELFNYVAASVGGALPQPGGRAGFPSFRVSNQRARKALAWLPFYPDYRVGLAR